MQHNIEGQIRGFVVENFLFGQDNRFSNADSFFEAGIVDSTGILEILSYLAEAYGINVEPEDLTPENFDSVSRVSRFVATKLASAPAACRETNTAQAHSPEGAPAAHGRSEGK